MKKQKILITGASGFTGQHACNHFFEMGYQITAAARKKWTSEKEVQSITCDLTNKASVMELIKMVKPDALLHLAGQSHVGDSWIDPIVSLESNLMSTAYLVEALRQEQPSCKIVIVGSTLQFDPQIKSSLSHPYSFSKTLQVLFAQAWSNLYNMNIVIAKPTNLIGPGNSKGVCSVIAKKVAEAEEKSAEKVFFDIQLMSERDFLDVRDAVSAYETLLINGAPGEIYNVSSGRTQSLQAILTKFKSLTKIDFEIKKNFEKREELQKSPPDKLKNLGWKPAISLETSLRDTLEYYRSVKKF
jgi:GDP-4-dehydro-6-deoxy-D-mannose reductase